MMLQFIVFLVAAYLKIMSGMPVHRLTIMAAAGLMIWRKSNGILSIHPKNFTTHSF